MNEGTWVCAFRGRRDDYQLPLALAESGQLDMLFTDFYGSPALLKFVTALPAAWRDKIHFRHKSGLPAENVRSLWGLSLLEHLRHRIGFSPAQTYADIDISFSQTAAKRARRVRGNLLLYTPYAWEAFTARYFHQPRRLLFQYHPHSIYEERLLREDAKLHPEVAYSFAQETGSQLSEKSRERVGSCWRHADRVICASTFTQDTLLEAGMDPKNCVVVPYGIDSLGRSAPADTVGPPEGFHALFVGSGIQRKGLHHLLRAWESACLPSGSMLTVVCRVLDPGLRERIRATPRVRFLAGVNRNELASLYQRSSLLAMPSLIEGFGQVYLEALAEGCPVLGTRNTCLPDLGSEEHGIFLTEVGCVDDLIHQLERLSRLLPQQPGLRERARACALDFTWQRFRDRVKAEL